MTGIDSLFNFTGYRADLLRGNTELLLLYLISEFKETYGYRLIKEIEERSKGYFRFKEGTVYPALHKLENEGLLKGEWKRINNGQERRYYRITEKGEKVLKKKLAMWQDFSAALGLVFGSV